MRDALGVVIPATAADPFVFTGSLIDLLETLTQTPAKEYVQSHSTSLMVRWNAHTVPLTPDLSLLPRALRKTVEECHDSMANFYPEGLDKNNIGSNIGLSRVVRKFYNERAMNSTECKRYTNFTVDVNIYDRMLKVCSC